MLTIDQATYDAIVAHAKKDHPDEACGIVAGPEGSDRAERLVEMVNAAGSPTFYEFDSTELLALYKDLWARDEEPVVVYHSHTATEAYPSRTDIGLASEPGAHYVLVSTREHGNNEGPVEFRSYRIVDGEVTEEQVVVVATEALPPDRGVTMTVEVRIPTILRSYTGDQKAVTAEAPRSRRGDRRPRGQPPRHQGAAHRGRPDAAAVRQRAVMFHARNRQSPHRSDAECDDGRHQWHPDDRGHPRTSPSRSRTQRQPSQRSRSAS